MTDPAKDAQDARIEQAATEAGLSEKDIVRSDIEQARAELAQTVDALSDKLNVKARVGDKVTDAKGKVADTASRAKHSAPEPVRRALEVTGQKAGPHRKEIGVGLAVAAIALLVLLRKRRSA